jgi:hypothetical protein
MLVDPGIHRAYGVLRVPLSAAQFTRTSPEDFIKEGYRFAGPEFGGIIIHSFRLKPVKDDP